MGTPNDAPPRLADVRDFAAGPVKIDARTAASGTLSPAGTVSPAGTLSPAGTVTPAVRP
jgi:hypothetical protein